MKLIYEGKTKDVYKLDDGHVKLKFKDDMTGEDGNFDPGANTVGLQVDGAGLSGLKMTTYFFEKLAEENIPTHFVAADFDDVTLTVKDAEMFGNGLEIICRYRAVGSFYRRYGQYCKEGQSLDGFVEVTLKDDERGDPPINKEALSQLGLLNEAEYDRLIYLTKEISQFVKDELAKHKLELYDIKLEFGRHKESGEMMLIDEISGGNMRVFNENNESVSPLELGELFSK